ncbi:MAG TPA: nuclear transport factor 2 family protein [Longimicrobiaceae bacterium]|nr:nuclear transport factor 2 family protein [Longimicrobiaceae bacterium]
MPATVRRLLLLLVLLACAAPAHAQVLPGFRRADANPHLRRFRAEMFEEVSATMTKWRQAWAGRDARAASRVFTEDGVLLLPERQKVQGHTALAEEFATVLPGAGALQFSIVDFAVSDGLAMASGRFWYETTAEGRPGPGRTGTYVAAFELEAGAWKIRMMLLRDERVPLS